MTSIYLQDYGIYRGLFLDPFHKVPGWSVGSGQVHSELHLRGKMKL